jgi:hypothetical protein
MPVSAWARLSRYFRHSWWVRLDREASSNFDARARTNSAPSLDLRREGGGQRERRREEEGGGQREKEEEGGRRRREGGGQREKKEGGRRT